jgi:hypothetical protein
MEKKPIEKYFVIIYALLIISVFVYSYMTLGANFFGQQQYTSNSSINLNNSIINLNKSCVIEFGKPECENGKTNIKFYNPSNISMSNISVVAKTFAGSDIYNIQEPLKSNKIENLDLFKCYSVESMEVNWCCGDSCYNLPTTDYSKEIS